MPVVGQRKSAQSIGQAYYKDPLYQFAKAFKNTTDSVLNESGLSYIDEPNRVLRQASTKEALKQFFLENYTDMNDNTKSAEEKQDILEQAEAQFENDVEAMYEHAALPEYNPIVGMALPIHKLILMNMVFDKGAIQKVTALSPKFTISVKRRILVTPSGEEIDMFTQQNLMTEAMQNTAPWTEIELEVPEAGTTDIIGILGGATPIDHLVINSTISAIFVKDVLYEVGDFLPDENGYVTEDSEIAESEQTVDTWFNVNIKTNPQYGSIGRIGRAVTQPVRIPLKRKNTSGEVEAYVLEDTISVAMEKDRFQVQSFGNITKVKIRTRLDTSNGLLATNTVKWVIDTELVEIDTAIPIQATISPEEVKDLAALYQVNQLTEIMGMFKTVLANKKDDEILQFLNDDWKVLHPKQKTYTTYDFAPDQGYALDYVEWRHKTFLEQLDRQVTKLLQVWNDPNVTVAIFGDPDLIRRVTPKEYTYQAPAALGPVELTYTQTVVNASDKRVYNFLGSDKLRGSDTFIIILNSRNSDHIYYRIYDYQMYISNEIRNSQNFALPNISCFERYALKSYQSCQGRIKILNPSGKRSETP